ncbi:adenylate/guanylate cyclase domain-containing protein [Streptomyces sp. 1222.5]|uniref:adenylate/guanylate cyclase domain-containing protein n=1 Tax=Streptomyces sp. 1222.5 TaxID=1881026 RepID=UPI003EBC392B
MEGGISILIADDDPVTRTVLSKLMERDGHSTQVANNGRSALQRLMQHHFDIMLLDIEMPELDGFGVLEHVKVDEKLRDLSIVVISALEDIESVVHAIELGADDYVTKPISRVLLRARMNAIIDRQRLQRKERERLRSAFARFVPEPLADQFFENAEESVWLAGERRDVTVLFSDLRAFTAWAENQTPERVLDVLNRYLGTMSDVIMDYGGTLASYMGDGIMALFGAPADMSIHADVALQAARIMSLEALDDFNDWVSANGFGGGFKMGIGLNSGPAMCGNVGSERRLEYTAVGDTVNTASRLEQMTKAESHMLLVSDMTRLSLHVKPDDLVPIGRIVLRGKKEPVAVWAVTSSAREYNSCKS